MGCNCGKKKVDVYTAGQAQDILDEQTVVASAGPEADTWPPPKD